MWKTRDELSWNAKRLRSIYRFLRDELDRFLISWALVDSYRKFRDNSVQYPFVKMRELKPRARVREKENELHNCFLVIFCEGVIPPSEKKYLRFFDSNKVTKENLIPLVDVRLPKKLLLPTKHFESDHFIDLLKHLMPVDYALLIQRDPSTKSKYRYTLTHFHVKVDWPIADAAEAMGKYLRYISKNLYEKGERYAELLQQKLFEAYGFHHAVGGRRTAAVVAFQFLKRFHFLSTVYVCSSEARTLTRLSERGVSKFVLILLKEGDAKELASRADMEFEKFRDSFTIAQEDDSFVVIFQVNYSPTDQSRPPLDGKLRNLNPDKYWLTVTNQLVIPMPTCMDVNPIPYPRIYQ